MRTRPHDHHLVMSQDKTTPVSPVEPVQFRGQSARSTREGLVDRSQLVATSGGAPRPLGVARLAMRRLSLTQLVSSSRDRRCTRPLGVVGLAMRRHSLEVHSTLGSCPTCHAATLPHRAGSVQWSERKSYTCGVGGSDPADGTVWRWTPTLGSCRTRHAAALPHQACHFSAHGGVTGDNVVRRVSHEKVTTDGVKTSRERALSERSELCPLSPGLNELKNRQMQTRGMSQDSGGGGGGGGGGGSAGLAPALGWLGAWLVTTHPTVDHRASWGVGTGHTNFSPPAEAGSEKLRGSINIIIN